MTSVDINQALVGRATLRRPVRRCASAMGRRMTCVIRSGKGEYATFGEIMDKLASRDCFVLLLVPSLLAVSPATVAFGVASLCGLMIALIASQALFRQSDVWLPNFVRQFKLKRATLVKATSYLDRPLLWLETHTTPRLSLFVAPPFRTVALVMCVTLGLAMPVMELVPLTSTTGAFAITLMMFGLILKDGLVTLLGALLCAVVVLLATQVLIGSAELLASVRAWVSQ